MNNPTTEREGLQDRAYRGEITARDKTTGEVIPPEHIVFFGAADLIYEGYEETEFETDPGQIELF